MPRILEPATEYAIDGRVIDRGSQRGLANLRVDAWQGDPRDAHLLGQAFTDSEGAFTIGFDSKHFHGERGSALDVFFNVFVDGRPSTSTAERPLRVAGPGHVRTEIVVDLPQAPTGGRDRVTALQAIKALDWWRASDFKGTWKESKDKAGTLGRLAASLAGGAVAKFDFQPIRPSGAREKEIVGQDVGHAQRALAARQVEVTDVKPIPQDASRTQLVEMARYPLQLKAGEKIVLYQENGTVRYYARVPAAAPASVDQVTVTRIDGDVQTLKTQLRSVDALRTDLDNLRSTDQATSERLEQQAGTVRAQSDEVQKLKRELALLRKDNADKNAQIAHLETELKEVRTAQDNLATRVPLERLAALERQVSRLLDSPGPRVAPGPAGGEVRDAAPQPGTAPGPVPGPGAGAPSAAPAKTGAATRNKRRGG